MAVGRPARAVAQGRQRRVVSAMVVQPPGIHSRRNSAAINAMLTTPMNTEFNEVAKVSMIWGQAPVGGERCA